MTKLACTDWWVIIRAESVSKHKNDSSFSAETLLLIKWSDHNRSNKWRQKYIHGRSTSQLFVLKNKITAKFCHLEKTRQLENITPYARRHQWKIFQELVHKHKKIISESKYGQLPVEKQPCCYAQTAIFRSLPRKQSKVCVFDRCCSDTPTYLQHLG